MLGSHGSVVPIFKRQIEEGGPVTLTHKDITRFFMTIPEAAQLVLQAGAYAKNGEIFVLDMGQPVKIYDLAEKLITLMGYKPNVDIKINVTGLRPGEKLYEELMLSEEGITQTNHKKIFIAKPLEYNYDSLYAKLNHFAEHIDEMSNNEVKHLVLDLVPTYHPQAEKGSASIAENTFGKERVIV